MQIQHFTSYLLLKHIAKKLSLHWHLIVCHSWLHILIYDFEPMKLPDALHASLVMSQPGHSYGCILLCRPFAFVRNICIQRTISAESNADWDWSLPVANMLCSKHVSAPEESIRRCAMLHTVGQS